MVFQDPYSAIDPRYTIADAVMEPFRIQGIRLSAPRKGATRVDASAVGMVGLHRRWRGNYPHQLSGGQKQRVGIARALALEADIPRAGRADRLARRLDPGADHRAARAAAGRTRPDLSVHLARSRRWSAISATGRRDVSGPRSSRSCRRPMPPPRHPYTRTLLDSTFEPDPQRRREIIRADRRDSEPLRPPARLRLCGALRSRRRPICREIRPELAPCADGHRGRLPSSRLS